MGIRDRINRLEREARRETIAIPQKVGTVARFPRSEVIEAHANWFERLGAGEDAPPEHPMIVAVRNSSDPEWQRRALMCEDLEEHTKPIPDLSEH